MVQRMESGEREWGWGQSRTEKINDKCRFDYGHHIKTAL